MWGFPIVGDANAWFDQQRHAVGLKFPDGGVIERAAVRQCRLAPAGIHVSSANVFVGGPSCSGLHDSGPSPPLEHAPRLLPALGLQKIVHVSHEQLSFRSRTCTEARGVSTWTLPTESYLKVIGILGTC